MSDANFISPLRDEQAHIGCRNDARKPGTRFFLRDCFQANRTPYGADAFDLAPLREGLGTCQDESLPVDLGGTPERALLGRRYLARRWELAALPERERARRPRSQSNGARIAVRS